MWCWDGTGAHPYEASILLHAIVETPALLPPPIWIQALLAGVTVPLLTISSPYSVILSLEVKLHLLHGYMNVKWIPMSSDAQVRPPHTWAVHPFGGGIHS